MGDEGAAAWNKTVYEWLVETKACYAGAFGQLNKGESKVDFWACATEEGYGEGASEADIAKMWSYVVNEAEYDMPGTADDGSETTIKVNECQRLYTGMVNFACPNGIYIAGEKFTIVRYDKELETTDRAHTLQWILAQRSKCGCHMVVTPTGHFVFGLYSEEKEQQSGNCKKAVVDMAEYLVGAGY